LKVLWVEQGFMGEARQTVYRRMSWPRGLGFRALVFTLLRLLFQPKPAVWAARALAKLKLGRIAQYLGNHWRYAVPRLLIYSLPAGCRL
jgi:hypothetical protein